MPVPTEPGHYWGIPKGYTAWEPLHVTTQAGELGFTRMCHRSNWSSEWLALRFSLRNAKWGARIPDNERLKAMEALVERQPVLPVRDVSGGCTFQCGACGVAGIDGKWPIHAPDCPWDRAQPPPRQKAFDKLSIPCYAESEVSK